MLVETPHNEDLCVTPNKKVINLTIHNHLVNTWCTEWNGLRAIIKPNIGSPCQIHIWHQNY